MKARIQGMKSQRVSNKAQKHGKAPTAGASSTAAGPVGGSVKTSDGTDAAASTAKTLSTSDKKNKHKLEAQERQQAKRVRRAGAVINDATDVSIISLGSQPDDVGSVHNLSAPPATDFDDLSLNTGSMVSMNSKAPVSADMQFSLIAQSTVLGAAAGEGEITAKAAKGKGNKLQRLQRMLAEAEKKRLRMKQLTAHGGEEGMARLQGEKWNDALKSAKGERTIIVGSSSIEGSEGKKFLVKLLE